MSGIFITLVNLELKHFDRLISLSSALSSD